MLNFTFNAWDVALIAVVVVQSTLLAYLHNYKWRTLLLMFPVPFTVASMAVGRPIDVTNIAGLINLLLFINVIRWLHVSRGVPIVVSITLTGLIYLVAGIGLAAILVPTPTSFWAGCALVLAVSAIVLRAMPYRADRSHRTSLPVWIKAPIIGAVVVGLILLKKLLKGFVPVFPMVTVVAAYEMRHSLWTMCRQIDISLLLYVPTFAAMHIAQFYFNFSIGESLVVAWVVFLALLVPVLRAQWKRHPPEADD